MFPKLRTAAYVAGLQAERYVRREQAKLRKARAKQAKDKRTLEYLWGRDSKKKRTEFYYEKANAMAELWIMEWLDINDLKIREEHYVKYAHVYMNYEDDAWTG